MSFKMRKLLEDHEDMMIQRFISDPTFRQATRMRRNFVLQAISKDPRFYRTQEEADWMYIVKREYNYIVLLKSAVWSILPFCVANTAFIYHFKRLTWHPFVVLPFAFAGFVRYFRLKHSKRLFDMCNIGEEHELGRERNRVLRRCNELLGVEDF